MNELSRTNISFKSLCFLVIVENDTKVVVTPYLQDLKGTQPSITFLNRTPIFEWYVVRCGSKNGYQIGMWLKEIGLGTQNLITILGSILNIILGSYMII